MSFLKEIDNPYLTQLVESYSFLPEVEAILIAGSTVLKSADELSDFDVYIYSSTPVPLDKRKQINASVCKYIENDNQFWETEDDGVLKDGTPIDLIYRSLDWLDSQIEKVAIHYQAQIGYTTCIWANLYSSKILYDTDGKAAALQKKYMLNYPQQLKQNIVNKNYPLLARSVTAFRVQIDKAVKRQDLVSINHRVAGFLASYFDIIYAVNGKLHLGEKRSIELTLDCCKYLPEDYHKNIELLIRDIGRGGNELVATIDKMMARLDLVLKKRELYPEE